MESGNVHLPHPAIAAWVDGFIEELGAFPNGKYDDQVDQTSQALNRLRGVATSSGYLATTVAVLAIGHSARDTYEMLLRRGVPMVPKPFQMGVRIEHPQELVNRVKYGPTR